MLLYSYIVDRIVTDRSGHYDPVNFEVTNRSGDDLANGVQSAKIQVTILETALEKNMFSQKAWSTI